MTSSFARGLIVITMFVAFFESLKYVGHLLPIAFLRIYLGFYYLDQALEKFRGDFLLRPRLAAEIDDVLPTLQVPVWYKSFLADVLVPYWKPFAFAITGFELAIAISFLLGYVTRPMALIGALLALNMYAIHGDSGEHFYKTLIAIHLVLAWIGAGRCLGFDYFFYKRRRGIWW